MEPDEQLEWERRAGRPAGLAAIAASLLIVAGTIVYPAAAIGPQRGGAADALMRINETPAHAYVPGILQALGYFAMTLPLYYLYRAAKARRPELPAIAKYLAILGPIVTGAAFLARQVTVAQAASDFADQNLPTTTEPGAAGAGTLGALLFDANDRAADLLTDKTGAPLLVALQYAGALSVAFAFVLVALNAMRAGLLSRFMGYVGVIIGVLTVLPLFGPSIVQVFWFAGVGMLLLDRWPNGRGPAWDVVEAVPWPSAAEQRAAAEGARDPEAEIETDGRPDAVRAEPAPRPHSSSKKRKKKRR